VAPPASEWWARARVRVVALVVPKATNVEHKHAAWLAPATVDSDAGGDVNRAPVWHPASICVPVALIATLGDALEVKEGVRKRVQPVPRITLELLVTHPRDGTLERALIRT